MEEIALHTRLKAGKEAEYEHDLFHMVDVEDDYSGGDRGIGLVWKLL